MRSLSVETKVTVLILALCLFAGVVGARLMGGVYEQQVEHAAVADLAGTAAEFQSQERSEIEKLSSTLDALLENEELARAFLARDRARLLALSAPLFERMRSRDRITHWYFIESPPAKTVFLRVHRPELHSDVVERATLAKAIASGDTSAGKELGQTAFALRAVAPWVRNGKVIGYMELAEEIDHFLTAMKGRTGDEYGILVKKEFLDEKAWARILGARANTWNDRPDVVVVDTTVFNLGITDYQGNLSEVPEGGKELGEVVHEDRAWLRGLFPLKDAAGRKVGGLFVLHDFTAAHRAIRDAMVQALSVMVAFALVIAVLLIVAVRLLVFRTLGSLADRLERAADAAGTPPERIVRLGAQDKLNRLEALVERVLEGGGKPPGGGAPPSAK